MSYYYLIASLPLLTLESTQMPSVDDFMELCAENLPSELCNQLAKVTAIPRDLASCTSEEKWNSFETALRNRVATWGAHKTKADVTKYLRYESDVFVSLEKEVEDAFDNDNPMKVEQALDAIRWQFLDNLETGNEFNFDKLFIYKVRLLIKSKWANLNVEKGEEQVKATVELILSKSAQV